jgi:integrase
MSKITVRQIEAAKPRSKPYKLTADKGLYVRVATNGTKYWLVRYVVDGKQHQMRLPSVYGHGEGFMSLAQATTENARIQSLAHDGIDVQIQSEEKRTLQRTKLDQAQRENLTVAELFESWVTDGVSRKDSNSNLNRSFNKDVLPIIGHKQIKALSEHDLRKIYKAVLARGVERTTVTLANDIGQMLRWAEKRQPWRSLLIEGNPSELVDVKQLLSHDYTEQRDRVLSADEIRELRDIFDNMGTNYALAPKKYDVERPLTLSTQCALWICLSTLCRIGELLMARWDHVNQETGEWFIPAENTKAHRGKKKDQTVFLSNFALDQFKRLHKLSGKTEWVFPAKQNDGHVCVKSVSKQIGDRQFQFKTRKELMNRTNSNSLVLSDGKNSEWTPHDLRRTGATMMQALGVPLEIIDRCQNHIMAGSKVRRHYLHYDYANEKRQAWAKLGERIEQILSADNLVELRGAA